MRIVGGRWAGVALTSPSGRVRPTGEDVRVEWMRELRDDLPGARVLELYAGSGAVGLEALSRGAASCDFVENGASALHALKANVAAVRARKLARIFERDALEFAGRLRSGSYDIVLADPPYGSRQGDRLVERWLREPFSRVLSIEHAWDHPLPAGADEFELGDAVVTTYRANDDAPRRR